MSGRQQRPSPRPPPLKLLPLRYDTTTIHNSIILIHALQRKHDSDGSDDEVKKAKSEVTETPKSEKKAKKHKSEKAEAADEVCICLRVCKYELQLS